ncbi:MAG: HpcH/HpaI aldolase family protein [Pseudonocardiaceae bacterium]
MIALPDRLREPRPLLGTLVTLASSEVAEALAICGIEWLFVDMEHSPALDPAAVQQIAQAVAGRCYTLVRVPVNDEAWIKKVLDSGADGVIVPHVRSGADARRAVLAAKYPPLGGRSVGIARAQQYGADFAGYLTRANDTTALVLQIEEIDAVQALDDILGTPGTDAVFIGPYDLSGSMGKLGQLSDPEVRAAIEEVLSGCKAAGMPLGIFAGTRQTARGEAERGINFIAIGTDLSLMVSAAKSAMAEIAAAP